ncbi:MAG: hypothetical protein FD143_197 [Ignavibacteria bacterium]|nr:MAG: hypothetical protein FD143_197 [Ignavibacteria bacterium]KAF0162114.1 MAG: hypothetical protein FD188_363 [Ignavibacteria bacterium]
MTKRNLVLFVPLIILSACISAEHTTEQTENKEPEVYVFDDIKKVDEPKLDTVMAKTAVKHVEPDKLDSVVAKENTAIKKYTVQFGAFTSKERADSFINENQSKTSLPMLVSFNAATKLFAVQVPPYKTKGEADIIRDNLRKFPAFSDSFTVLVEN